MESIAIVGASLAGIRAAQVLRSDGFDGPITLIGEEAHRPYDRPPLSKNALAGELGDKNEMLDTLALVKPEEYAALELDEKLGWQAVDLKLAEQAGGRHSIGVKRADGTDKNTTEEAGETEERVEAEAVLIATGARPRNLPNPENLEGIYTLRSLENCTDLFDEFSALSSARDSDPSSTSARLAVVGAGFIGCEVAATARQMGLEVSLVEMGAAPLELVLGREMGDFTGAIHKEKGVDLHTDTKVEKFIGKTQGDSLETGAKIAALELSDGTTLEADLVVVGIGVIPNTEWLEGSGLALDNGVVCDENCLAADGVAAAGDVARWENKRFNQTMRVEHWDNAIEQSKAAARRLLAGDDLRSIQPYAPIPWFWSDQYDLKIQLAGLSSPTDELTLVEGSFEERKFTALYMRDGKTVGVLGLNSPRQVMQYRQKIEEDFPLR